MANQNSNKVAGLELKIDNIIKGINEHIPANKALVYNGEATTQPKILAMFEALQASYKARRNYRGLYEASVEEIKTKTDAAAREAIENGKDMVKNFLGKSNTKLTDFGIPVKRSRKPLTAEQTVAAAAKAKATREARRTMGSRQKAAIKGNVADETDPQTADDAAIPTTPPPATSDKKVS